MLARVLGLGLLLIGLGCEGETDPPSPRDAGSADSGPEDSGPEDTGPEDTGAPDSGPDLGTLDGGRPGDLGVHFAAASCAPCEGGCPGNGACLNTATESFCADRCDEHLDGCVSGFTCANIAAEGDPAQYFCIPPGATCLGGVGYGTPCFSDSSACVAGMDRCEGDAFALGYCTTQCSTDADCPVGYGCNPGDEDMVCTSLTLTRAEACGVPGPLAATCGTHYDCAFADGERCVRSTGRLAGICAPSCEAGCPMGTACLPTAEGERCLPEPCACHARAETGGQRDLLAEALAAHQLGRCDALHFLADLTPNPPDIAHDPYRLGHHAQVSFQPLEAPTWAHGVVRDLEPDPNQPAPMRAARMVERLATRLDRPAQRRSATPPDPGEPLVEAVAAFIELAGGVPDRAAVRTDAQDLEPELRAALALVVEGMTRAAAARQDALPSNSVDAIFRLGPSFVALPSSFQGLDPAQDSVRTLLNEGIQYGRLYGGTVDLLERIAEADLQRFRLASTRTSTAPAEPSFRQATPWGLIVVGGGEPDTYEPDAFGPIALLLERGGSDLYRIQAGANASADNPVSVLIDLDGDDRYLYREVFSLSDGGSRLPSDGEGRYRPRGGLDQDNGAFSFSTRARWGSGRAGIAVHWDAGAGEDHYRSLRMSEGSGIFGAGVLIDGGGDDLYELEAMGQGAGAFGIGLLLDEGGSDVRRAYQMAQGFGYTRGAGALVDQTGEDSYLLNVGDPDFGGDPLYFSAQRPGRANTSLGQGFGFGRRDDRGRQYFSGGIGILLDEAGADRYEASIFAQGGGFWFGSGILADRSGDDEYDALWYAMGTGAHYALGLLLDGSGADVYGGALPRVNVTMAGGHDYSTAFLIDDEGDDIYWGSRISLGAGNVNGLGFFADNAGNDQYALTRDYGLGGAGNLESPQPGSARRKVKNLGVFIDAQGQDTYEVNGMPHPERQDDLLWTSAQNEEAGAAAVELGVGLDGEGLSTLRAFPPAQ